MAFTFKLETADGAPADPPTLLTVARSGAPVTRSRSALARSAWSRFATATPIGTRCWSSRTCQTEAAPSAWTLRSPPGQLCNPVLPHDRERVRPADRQPPKAAEQRRPSRERCSFPDRRGRRGRSERPAVVLPVMGCVRGHRSVVSR
jgi:hypothetical protein